MDARVFQPAPGKGWRTSRLSGQQGSCVQVARDSTGQWGVRNSRDRSGPVLVFTPAEWDAFVDGVKRGEFDE